MGKGVDPNGPFWEPDYDDPIFLEKLDHFLAALARRYDGNPEVAFIDVGSVGVWGEGHTYASTRLHYSAETIRRHIDLHTKHFKKTLLAANDDFALQDRGRGTIEYAARQGLTLRDDSILVQGGQNAYFNADFASLFWERTPIVLESEHFGPSRDRGNWKDGSQYLEAIENYHASYASIHWWPREFLAENRDLVRKISLRLGYRLQLVEASWPSEITIDGRFWFATTWRNAGVAPCLPGGHPALTLKDAKGGIAAVFVDDGLDMRDLLVAEPGQAPTQPHRANFGLPLASDRTDPPAEARRLRGLHLRRHGHRHTQDRPAPATQRRPSSISDWRIVGPAHRFPVTLCTTPDPLAFLGASRRKGVWSRLPIERVHRSVLKKSGR